MFIVLPIVQCFCGDDNIFYCLWCFGCLEDDDAARNRPRNLDEEERRRQAQYTNNQPYPGLSKEELEMTPDQLYYYHQRQQQQQQLQQQHLRQEPNPFLTS